MNIGKRKDNRESEMLNSGALKENRKPVKKKNSAEPILKGEE